MTQRVYYDVGAFAYFFLKSDKEIEGHRFSPKSRYMRNDPPRINLTSPFVREEFLYNFFTERKWGELIPTNRRERIEKLKEISKYSMFFDYGRVDLEEVTRLFQRLVLDGIKQNIVKEKPNEEKKLDMYDFLHLAFSFLAEADCFLTSDLGFEKLESNLTGWTGLKGRFELSKIFIYPPNEFDKEPKIIRLREK